MKRNVFFPITLVVVVATFLAAMFLADANLSFAASSKKGKSPAVAKTSAVDQTEARIKQLQGALKITKDQEELWNNLTQAMRENAKEMDALTKDMAEKTKTMNAVEHVKMHGEITEAHLNQLKKFIEPFEALYSIMSDEQKNTTDRIFRTGDLGKQKRK